MPNDYPLDEVLVAAAKYIEDGCSVYQKYTCGGCGSRLTIERPNTFHLTGACDKCDHITDIKKSGCNYMLIRSLPNQET